MQAQPSAKSSFCLGTDSTAISQSLLNPFLLAVVWQLFQALLRTTCRTETEKRAFFIHISFSLLYVCVCLSVCVFATTQPYFEDTFLPRIVLELTNPAFWQHLVTPHL